jgi:hypothetical protein
MATVLAATVAVKWARRVRNVVSTAAVSAAASRSAAFPFLMMSRRRSGGTMQAME